MNAFLLDACVLSELVKQEPDTRVKAWVGGQADDRLYISVVSVAEIVQGIERMEPGVKRDRLSDWLEELVRTRRQLILDIDLEVARAFGTLQGRATRDGRRIPVQDGWIAASAKVHDLTLVTRNVGDLEGAGVVVLNPWKP
ncbi:MAG: type II toxin-antitoxin system VapC family toxin [Acidobacteria bacterium]|nr:type II toxin-antitoxin system VapC family toxin [Acidobacteriota bacterium]